MLPTRSALASTRCLCGRQSTKTKSGNCCKPFLKPAGRSWRRKTPAGACRGLGIRRRCRHNRCAPLCTSVDLHDHVAMCQCAVGHTRKPDVSARHAEVSITSMLGLFHMAHYAVTNKAPPMYCSVSGQLCPRLWDELVTSVHLRDCIIEECACIYASAGKHSPAL